MRKGLIEINQIEGVHGSFVVDDAGAVIEADPPLELTAEDMDTIGRRAVQVFLGLETWSSPAHELDFQYLESRLIVRELDPGVLIMVCDPGVDTSLLRLNVNVVLNRWREDKKVQKRFRGGGSREDVELPDLAAEDSAPEGEDLFFS